MCLSLPSIWCILKYIHRVAELLITMFELRLLLLLITGTMLRHIKESNQRICFFTAAKKIAGALCWEQTPQQDVLPVEDVPPDAAPPILDGAQDEDEDCVNGTGAGNTATETSQIHFFRVMDSSSAFSHLTLLGDSSGMVNVDFLAQTYMPVHIERKSTASSASTASTSTPPMTGATVVSQNTILSAPSPQS